MTSHPLLNSMIKRLLLPGLSHVTLFLISALLCLSTSRLNAAESVEITGTYQLQVSCHDTHHEELCMVVVPGKDKFSGVHHIVDIPNRLKKNLQLGDKIIVRGKRQPPVEKRMTRGEVRKAMVKVIKNQEGLPVFCKEMDSIMGKILMKPAPGAAVGHGGHQHGELVLQRADDDALWVKVHIPAHLAVENVQIIK